MKKKIILFLFTFLSALSLYDAVSKPYGYPNYSGGFGEGTCATSCHHSLVGSINGVRTGNVSDPSFLVTASLIGLSPNGKYELAKTYRGYVDIVAPAREHWGLSVVIGRNSVVSGLAVGDNAGVIVPTNPQVTRISTAAHAPYIRRYLVHTTSIGDWGSPVIATDHYRFEFTWVSPATPGGNITFYWIGMATDSQDNDNSDDWIGTGNYTYYPPF